MPPTWPGWIAFLVFIALSAWSSVVSERARIHPRRPTITRLLKLGVAMSALTLAVLLGHQVYVVLVA